MNYGSFTHSVAASWSHDDDLLTLANDLAGTGYDVGYTNSFELVGDEGECLEAATREDYEPFFAFAKASGLRLRECLLRWPEVNWDASRIQKRGKAASW